MIIALDQYVREKISLSIELTWYRNALLIKKLHGMWKTNLKLSKNMKQNYIRFIQYIWIFNKYQVF